MTKTTLCLMALGAFLLLPAVSQAAAPSTAEVLGKLHRTNQHEIEMGKEAEKDGNTKAVKDFGKMLVKDHTAADKKTMALAKKEKIDITASTPAMQNELASIPPGPDYDSKFAQAMVDGHKKAIADLEEARASTDDPQLKKLITELLPTLHKHEDTAQRILDGHVASSR